MQIRGESVGSVLGSRGPNFGARSQSLGWCWRRQSCRTLANLSSLWDANCAPGGPTAGYCWRCYARFNVVALIGLAVWGNDRQLLRGNARAEWVMGKWN